MKRIKRLFIAILLLSIIVIGVYANKQMINASGLVVMKDHEGKDMTYRNSSEKVYQLEEYNYPTSQLRAVWISAFVSDIPRYQSETQFKTALTAVLDNMESMGMNAMVYHLRTHNNAMYKSELNPLAIWYNGVNFDEFDPTAWLIEECHKRGIEFHAWLNPYRISSNGSIPYNTVGEIPEGNPALDSSNLIKVGNNIILDPGIPSNRDFIVDTCMEIVENYDVDAIHFDDYFYISGSVDDTTRAKYNIENLSIGDFRRKQVDLFIEDLSNHLRKYNKENNKTVQLGISPSGIYQNGSYKSSPTYDANGNLTSPVYSNTSGFAHYDDYLYSDTLNWINNEWIDYIMPQCYWASEHTAASFVELTKWWSWAVRNKKVNFYTGMGIYMALEPTSSSGKYWQYNTDEIQKQLLNAGQYAEFSGACFYKYASLKQTSNACIKAAVDLISNDYWAKRVPAAVQKYYAPLLDEISPTNVLFNKATNTITYDPVDNVRGYMIYQVPKGETLDKNNIDHVLGYIQDTKVTVTDTTNYDYYVSSVNLANETSEAVYVNISLNAQSVINAINNLPANITYENKSQIENIRKLYEILPEEEKQKVTNISKLENAESTINNYSSLVEKLDKYIQSLDLHIKTNRIIPTIANITLSYKNQDDSKIYNLSTGERLKNYLATKYITLIATLNEADLTLSKEFQINVGYLSYSQTGLFYRNDASCMGPDDEGAYSETDSKYIGWSGHTVVVDNCVLFVADNNYHEITDPLNIDNCSWTSVAGVYVNKSNQTVTMNLLDAFSSHSADDGYFIIVDNKIKTVVDEWDTTVDITLNYGEILVIIRYLDHLINGSNMSPLSSLYVGQKAYIDEEKELTNEEKAEQIINLINTIPTNITLNDEGTINYIKEKYDALTEEVKNLVTNKDKLTQALNTISSLKKEIEEYKETNINNLNNYLDKTLYSETAQNSINQILTNAKTDIENASTKESVDLIVLNAKTSLDDVKTLQEELYEFKQHYIKKVDELVSSYKDITKAEKAEITRIANSFKEQINVSTTQSDVTYIYSRAQATIKEYFENLESSRTKVETQINDYINTLDYVSKELDNIKNLANEEIKYAKECANLETINNIVKNFIEKVESLHEELEAEKENATNILNDLIESWYTNSQVEYINELIEKANINSLGTIEEVKTVKDNTISSISTYIEEIEKAILGAIDYVKTKEDKTNTEITSLINSTKSKISNAKTVEDVNNLLVEFNTKYDEIINSSTECTHTYDNDCDTTCNVCNETRTTSHKWQNATYNDPKTCSVCGKTEGSSLKETVDDAIIDSIEIVLKVTVKTNKAQELVDDTINALEDAKSINEVNDIMNYFNKNINAYNKKTSKCSNNTYIYLNILLASLGLLLLLRKKRFN